MYVSQASLIAFNERAQDVYCDIYLVYHGSLDSGFFIYLVSG
jgi:hypothetical protein